MIRNEMAAKTITTSDRKAWLVSTGDTWRCASVFICESRSEGSIGARCSARCDCEYAEAGWPLAIEQRSKR